jgi:hypothetical protein
MSPSDLPEDGPLHIEAVELPAGRRVAPLEEPDADPVAWVTDRPLTASVPTWTALAELSSKTGLQPVLLADDESEDSFYFLQPVSVDAVDLMTAAAVLGTFWSRKMPSAAEEQRLSERWTAKRGPYSRIMPGLADREEVSLTRADLGDSVPAARIGLVAAARPADVLPTVGWSTFDDSYYPVPNSLWIAAVLRSWEDRFGARLLSLGPGSSITLLVARPPRSLDRALPVAAEHFAFADECDGCGSASFVPQIAQSIIAAPIWTFFWD